MSYKFVKDLISLIYTASENKEIKSSTNIFASTVEDPLLLPKGIALKSQVDKNSHILYYETQSSL